MKNLTVTFWKNTLATLLALLLALLAFGAAWAGGWAVISVEPLPDSVQPGQPFMIDFTVLQHGQTPMVGLDPAPSLSFSSADEQVWTFAAEEQAQPGRYQAEVTLPVAGSWDWQITAFTVTQAMPPVQVADSQAGQTAAAATAFTPTAALLPPLLLTAGALLLLGAGIYLRRRPARQLTPLLLILAVALAAGALLSGGQAQANEPGTETAVKNEASLVEQGNGIFTRRGCITCHAHAQAQIPAAFAIDVGPDLTNYQSSPDFLRRWLADPQALRPQTYMPDLGLQQKEIEALIVFLNQAASP